MSDKPPIDDLFARKLRNASLPPSADGYERLQARMGRENGSKQKAVFWRNPASPWYTAAAACVVLVALFGWLYQSSEQRINANAVVATNTTALKRPMDSKQWPERKNTAAKTLDPRESTTTVAATERENLAAPADPATTVSNHPRKLTSASTLASDKPVIANAQKPAVETGAEKEDKPAETIAAHATKPNVQPTAPAPTVPPVLAAERVLTVTIAEPKALVAARQVTNASPSEAEMGIAANDKPHTESKAGAFWHQLKRVKQGDLFARRDTKDNNEESSLLGRAYDGLRQNLDKNKSTKQ